jgi:NAD(P)-dependent dehydrogenase (short-subunit alcohol dehydrogenase family)
MSTSTFGSRVAVVAGAGSGLGAHSASLLAAREARVVVGDLDGDAAGRVVEEIRAAGGTAVPAQFDICDEASVEALFTVAVAEFGGVDLLVNSAADLSPGTLGRDSDALTVPLEVWRRTFAVDLTGYLLTVRAALPLMLARGRGAIVNISSGASVLGEDTRPSYGAAKAGVNALTRHVARRWGKEGIRCNAIAPGLVLTESAALNMGPKADDRKRTNPTGRLGETADIASATAYLLSDEAGWVNGQVLHVSGGQVMAN